MVDRLLLNKERIESMAKDILKVIDLQDPMWNLYREIERAQWFSDSTNKNSFRSDWGNL